MSRWVRPVALIAPALRAAAHMAAWAPFVFAAVHLLQQRWRPVSDAAAIAIRSWDVLTVHGPMMGQATMLAHGVFDPGPLEYWLLAIPVRLDPAHGLLWGAALWCMLAASVTIEAAWSVAGVLGGVVASGTVLATVEWMPGVALEPYWNPWFGVMFLIAALGAAWAVMSGHRGWWPVLVIAGSISAQAHLLFAVTSVALVFVALVTGLADSGRRQGRYGWVIAGFTAGAACWSAPLIQQATAANGNLLALIRGEGTTGDRTGLAFGLKALAGSAGPHPLWWTPLQSLLDLRLIDRRSAVVGTAILIVTVIVMIGAVRPLRSRRLAALAGLSLVADVGALATYSGIAVQSIPAAPNPLYTLNYLMILMLPAGVLCWLTVAAALVLSGRLVMSRAHDPAASPAEPGTRATTRWEVSVAALAALAGGVLVSSLTVGDTWHQFPAVADHQVVRLVTMASRHIERQLPRQPIALSVVSADPHYHTRRLLLGLTWALRVHGYAPELGTSGWELGSQYISRGHSVPRVRVLVAGSGDAVTITGR